MTRLVSRPAALRLARMAVRPSTGTQCFRCYSDASPPALLSKLRSDLKTAMKTKDKDRLNVLRSLLAEVTNASKTKSPIQTDIQVLSLLRKRKVAAKTASEDFSAAGRSDLVEEEERQVRILDGYAGEVKKMSESEITEAVSSAVEALQAATEKVNMGDVLRKLLGPGGALDGKTVERSEVARLVRKALGQ